MRLRDECKFPVRSGKGYDELGDERVPDEVKGFKSVFRNGTLLEVGTFSGQTVQWLRDEGKVLDVVAKEVAESDELANLSKIAWRWHVTEQLEFSATWPDEPEVGYFGVSGKAFGQIDFELVFFQLGEDLIEDLQVMLMSGCVDDDIVDVHNDVVNAVQFFLHKLLE